MLITTERCYAAIEAGTARLAGLVSGADLTARVPCCPDWTLRQLATHVGRAHRWAAEITTTRSQEFIPFQSVPDGKFPDDPAQHAGWLTAGASRLTKAVQAADQAPVWALGSIEPATFWARRMTHETLVHAADGQQAAGEPVTIAADLAADAVDEWLTFMSGPVFGRKDPRAVALPEGSAMRVLATDESLTGSAHWLVSHAPSGVTVLTGQAASDGASDVTLTGPAEDLLLVLVRRRPLEDSEVTVLGDADLAARWLAETSF